MPKAYDLRHNYYQDLDLPTTASIEDVKKSYRKLALIYHPDRNAGKEEEFIPKFQAIQAAHEILGDAVQKSRYDADRRKAALYSNPTPHTAAGSGGRGNPVGNPYQATSPYPPPPRRTQPGTWQRPASGASPAGASAYTHNGADRFTNFARAAPAPTAKKSDPAQDRTNMFRAWQNMHNAQERQRFQQANPQPQPQPQSTPRRPQPPPRQDTEFPTEEKIRAGMKHHGPTPAFNRQSTDRAEDRQSAWAAFQQASAGKPGVGRSNTTRTPKKAGGFDPNAPGSDERPAPNSQHYVHRHRSEDFGRPAQPGGRMPPPPPGPPPSASRPDSPISPTSPRMQRPFADPLRPFKSRTMDEDVPYAEGTRVRTPYSSFIGEKYQSAGADMRRSTSTMDATKIHPQANTSRPRSTSPLGRHKATTGHPPRPEANTNHDPNQHRPTFTMYSSSEDDTDPDLSRTSEQSSPTSAPRQTAGSHAGHRPKKVPSPPSKKYSNGVQHPFAPPGMGSRVGADGVQSEGETPGMGKKGSSNMYAHTFPFEPRTPQQYDAPHCASNSPFDAARWAERSFGSAPTAGTEQQGKPTVPNWAIPSSVPPGGRRQDRPNVASDQSQEGSEYEEERVTEVGAVDDLFKTANKDEQDAFMNLRYGIQSAYGDVPPNLDMEVFLKLASTARSGASSTHSLLDRVLARTLRLYPSVGYRQPEAFADMSPGADSFTYPLNDDMFAASGGANGHTNGKARSEENINTRFSGDGWKGIFTGSTDYFSHPATPGRKPSGSPTSRNGNARPATKSAAAHGQPVDATMPNESAEMPPPPRPDGTPVQNHTSNAGVKFSKEQWEQTFQDASWTWPPPPPKPPSPVRAGAKSRKGSKASGRATSAVSNPGTATNPHVVEGGGQEVPSEKSTSAPVSAAPTAEDGDAMDIDNTPPAEQQPTTDQSGTPTQAANTKEPRMVSVPPSPWRQQQRANGHRKSSSSSSRAPHAAPATRLKTNLDDLANVEPLARSADGLHNLADISQTLPFQSQPSATLPTHPLQPQTLQTPAVPKAPQLPARLSKASWHAYAEAFATYLRAFHSFNSTMLKHFEARELQARARMQQGMGWLEATGDTSGMLTGPSGYGTYLQSVKEDERVRECWNLGCERHLEACGRFKEVRERVRKLVVGGGLAEY